MYINIYKCNNKKKTSCYSNKASKTSLPSPSLLPHCQGPPSRSLQPHHNNALKQRSVRSAPSIATHHPSDLLPHPPHYPVSTIFKPQVYFLHLDDTYLTDQFEHPSLVFDSFEFWTFVSLIFTPMYFTTLFQVCSRLTELKPGSDYRSSQLHIFRCITSLKEKPDRYSLYSQTSKQYLKYI